MASFKKITSTNIKSELKQMSSDVWSGQAVPVDLMIALKEIKEVIDDIETFHQDVFRKQAEMYNKQEYSGYLFEVRTGGGRYNYDHIPEIVSLTERLKELQQKAQSSYKVSMSGMNTVSDDGELIAPAKFVPSKDSIIIKKKSI